jgi:hypothetical protein
MCCKTGTCSSRCADRPEDIRDTEMCLASLSKNLEGELRLLDRDLEQCAQPRCITLKTLHYLRMNVKTNDPCDSEPGRQLDGVFQVRDLTHAFMDGDGNRRGFHGGNFRWTGSGLLAVGSISGITNAGTHREPVFDPCQRCEAPGYMEGRFCGIVRRAQDQALVGCQSIGTYRFRFDPSSGGGEGAIRGTLEGGIVCSCQDEVHVA